MGTLFLTIFSNKFIRKPVFFFKKLQTQNIFMKKLKKFVPKLKDFVKNSRSWNSWAQSSSKVMSKKKPGLTWP